MAREVGNLGIDVSIRYAEDRGLVDEGIVRDALAVSSKAKIGTIAPSFISEADTLLNLGPKNLTWGQFAPPKGFNEGQGLLFSAQIAPALGIADDLEQLSERIHNAPLPKVDASWQDQKKLQEVEKQKNILGHALEILRSRNKDLLAINAARSQYYRG